MNIDPSIKTTFPAEIVEYAVAALNNRNGTVVKNVELTGRFPSSGAVKFTGCFAFDMAICKVDCELFVGGRPQRFAGEVVVNPTMNATAWWPRFGWAPVLCTGTDSVQLQGRPGDTWSVIGSMVARAAVTDYEKQFESVGQRMPAPTKDGETIDCEKYTAVVPHEGRL